mgnify:CR=1 FL=1
MDIKQKISAIISSGIDRESLRLMLGFYTEESFEEFLNGKKASPTVYKKIDELLNGKA